jgi:tryptophan-rich sensory protein
LVPPLRSSAFWLILTLMVSNASWNWLFFRQRNLRSAYLFFFFFFLPYSVLAIAVVAALLQVDRLSGIAFAIYLIYLPYALAWSFQIWRLNASVPKLGGSQNGRDKSN